MNDEGGIKGFIRDILRGGLPEVLDFPSGSPAPVDAFPEQRPSQDVQTRENANPEFGSIRFDTNILTITAIAVAAIGVVSLLR